MNVWSWLEPTLVYAFVKSADSYRNLQTVAAPGFMPYSLPVLILGPIFTKISSLEA